MINCLRILLGLSLVSLVSCTQETVEKNQPKASPHSAERTKEGPGDSGGGDLIQSTAKEVIAAIYASRETLKRPWLISEIRREEARYLHLLGSIPDSEGIWDKYLVLDPFPFLEAGLMDPQYLNPNDHPKIYQKIQEEPISIEDFEIDLFPISLSVPFYSPLNASNHLGLLIDDIKLNLKTKGYCPASDKDNALASVSEFSPHAEICFSIEHLKALPKTSLEAHVAGLWFHELAHMRGIGEERAQYLQNAISIIYPFVSSQYNSDISRGLRRNIEDRTKRILNSYQIQKDAVDSKDTELQYSVLKSSLELIAENFGNTSTIKLCQWTKDASYRFGRNIDSIRIAIDSFKRSKDSPGEIRRMLQKLITWQMLSIYAGTCEVRKYAENANTKALPWIAEDFRRVLTWSIADLYLLASNTRHSLTRSLARYKSDDEPESQQSAFWLTEDISLEYVRLLNTVKRLQFYSGILSELEKKIGASDKSIKYTKKLILQLEEWARKLTRSSYFNLLSEDLKDYSEQAEKALEPNLLFKEKRSLIWAHLKEVGIEKYIQKAQVLQVSYFKEVQEKLDELIGDRVDKARVCFRNEKPDYKYCDHKTSFLFTER